MPDTFTAEARLCDDDGVVRKGLMHKGTDYPCTGHAHYAGEHYRCTSPAHEPGGAFPERCNHVEDVTHLGRWCGYCNPAFGGDRGAGGDASREGRS